MKRLAVFVATTGGPVRIERITRERAPQSMVCLKRSSTVLPISAAYDSFVRRGSGVIEKVLGPFEDGAFRLDMSEAVETGESWQLGVFTAHAAAKEGRLATLEIADAVVWLTGHVDYDLAVGSVGHLAEKIHAARDAMATWVALGRPVTAVVHDGVDRETLEAAGVPAGVRIVPVKTALEALRALDLKVPAAASPASNKRFPAWAVGFAAFTVLGFSLFSLSQHSTQMAAPAMERMEAVILEASPAPQASAATPPVPIVIEAVEEPLTQPVLVSAPPPAMETVAPEAPEPALTAPKVMLFERRAPEGHTCAEVQFGAVDAVKVPVADTSDMSTSRLDGVCGLAVAVDNGEQDHFVAVVLDVLSGKLLYGTTRPDIFGGTTAFDGRHEWPIDLPRRLAGPFEIRVAAISAAKAVGEQAQWFGAQADAAAAAKELSAQGIATATVHHRVTP